MIKLRSIEEGGHVQEVVTVRWFEELSLDEVNDICVVFNEAFIRASKAGIALYRRPEEWLERYGSEPRVEVALLKVEGRVVATTVLTFKDVVVEGDHFSSCFIDDVAVLPHHQGRGYGRLVFDRALKRVEEEKVDFTMLYTARGSIAWNMYRRRGFKDIFDVGIGIFIADKTAFLGLLPRWLDRVLVRFVSFKPRVEEHGKLISVDDAIRNYADLGPTLSLYSSLSEKRLRRKHAIAEGIQCTATLSLRDYHNIKGQVFHVGLISDVVFSEDMKASSLASLILYLIHKAKNHGLPLIVAPSSSHILSEALKLSGIKVVKGGCAMILTENKEVLRRIEEAHNKGYLFTPAEHILGEY
ncbi:MAG: hypothetical protein DRN15_04140 [Thermoprotei archaeon]|nr:MAG: hypothetical protein DRN15_04140 [Thermoprotei archaeon]